MLIRDATTTDVVAINALYNALIDTDTVAWTEEHEPIETRAEWLVRQQEAGHPVLVAALAVAELAVAELAVAVAGDGVGGRDDGGGDVVGFASYDDFRDSTKWPGYRFTVEHTVHVDGRHQGAGVGRSLMTELADRARAAGKCVMIGAIDGANTGSILFHQQLGFVEVARMPGVGFKFGRWLNLVLMQRRLAEGPEG